MSSPKLFIDGSNIAYVCMFAAEKRKGDMEEAFEKVYHNLVTKLRKMYPFHELIFAWEGEGNSIKHRLEMFPGYKQNRQGGASRSTKVYRKIAKKYNEEAGYANADLFETEADDTIYALANIFSETCDRNVIISSDHDFIQIAQEGLTVEQYSCQSHKFVVIPEYDIVKFKSLSGDSSDGIPGVVGCGPKTALKYMKEGIPAEHQATYEKFFEVVSMSHYAKKHNTIKRLREQFGPARL